MEVLRRNSIPAIYLSIPWIRFPDVVSRFVDSSEDIEMLTEIKSVCFGTNCISSLESPHTFMIKGVFPDNILSLDGTSEEIVEWQYYHWKLWDVLYFIKGGEPAEAVPLKVASLSSQYLESISNQSSCIPMLKELKKFLDFGELTNDDILKIQKLEEKVLSQSRLVSLKGSDTSYAAIRSSLKATQPRAALSEKIRKSVLRRDNYSCIFCGSTSNESRLEVDHIIPRALIKKIKLDEKLYTSEENLCTTCINCNREKSDYMQPKDIAHYIRMFGKIDHPNHAIVPFLINIQSLQRNEIT